MTKRSIKSESRYIYLLVDMLEHERTLKIPKMIKREHFKLIAAVHSRSQFQLETDKN